MVACVLNPVYFVSIIQDFKSLTVPSVLLKFCIEGITSSIGVSTGISYPTSKVPVVPA